MATVECDVLENKFRPQTVPPFTIVCKKDKLINTKKQKADLFAKFHFIVNNSPLNPDGLERNIQINLESYLSSYLHFASLESPEIHTRSRKSKCKVLISTNPIESVSRQFDIFLYFHDFYGKFKRYREREESLLDENSEREGGQRTYGFQPGYFP